MSRIFPLPITIIAALTLAAAGAAADPPAATQPLAGSIVAKLTPARAVKSVRCLDRNANMTYVVEHRTAGQFTVANLPAGRRYDLEVTGVDGRLFIGVDLSAADDRLLRLASEQAGQADEPPGPLTDDDRRQIEQIVTKIDTFHDRQRIIHIRGDHGRATALVELLRTRPFHSGRAGEWIRRIEVWQFKFQHGGWEKQANVERVLSRVRAERAVIEQQMAREVYVPELGGLAIESGQPGVTVDLSLPVADATTRPDG